MEHSPVNPNSRPDDRTRPFWVRAVMLAAIWTMVLQPAVSSAQLSQSPMFTVTSAPPNVMVMFDDSASMNRLDLNPPPAYANPTFSLVGTAPTIPTLKLNTVGYYGISGMRWYKAGNAAYDDHWQFGINDALTRSPAFNPLAYNPAIYYQPWNNNGVRFPVSSIGGNTNVAAGALTEWDPRNLPPAMGGGTVFSKLALPRAGVIDGNGETRSWAAPVAGSVAYTGIPGMPALAGVELDLFNSTIVFDNPNCGGTAQNPTTYAWYCPAGTPWASPPEVCDATNDGLASAAGRECCVAQVNNPTFTPAVGHRFQYFTAPLPPGPPYPAMTGPAGEVCTSIVATGATSSTTGAPCTVPVVLQDDPPYEVVCGTMGTPAGGEYCEYDPPPVMSVSVCTTYTTYQWDCTYDYTITTNNYSCPAPTAQFCGSTPGAFVCTGQAALTTTSDARVVSGYWTPARYVIYDGPATRTAAEISDLSNYRMIFIDRKFGWNGVTQVPTGTNSSDAVGKYYVVDGVTGLPAPPGSRPDCAAGTWCTFVEEAKNYANWYTYYRSRLFAAIAVMSEVASGLTGPEQFMRMGYGRINYFPRGKNPWNVLDVNDRLPNSLPAVDPPPGTPNDGGVERGVRPFTVNAPPLSAIPNPDRQAVFDWLFTINGLGPTPNREALHGAGLYFTRADSRGPWGAFPGSGNEPPSQHLWCRRNYTLLATDGEWTRLPAGQPLLESGSLALTRTPVGGPGSVSQSMSVDGPAITGTDRDPPFAPLNYQYLVASEPQISGGFGSTQTETLTDVLHYYWSHDLRPPGPDNLRNSIKSTPRNRAFWQHMSSYIVGYGVIASVDDPARVPALRTDFDARNAIAWPEVGQEACRQLDDNVDDTALNPSCVHTVAPSGNRINDTLRAGLTSGGDFFSATSPAALKSSLQAVFAAIGSDNAAGTSPGLSSSTVGAGNIIIQSGFFTNTWDGYVRAFDQIQLLTFLTSGGVAPTPLWSINFFPPATRPIFSSTAINTPITFDWPSLGAPQQAALGSSLVLDYLRGDQSRELRFPGGLFRNRVTTILGDIVNSTPLYSKAADFGYARKPAASVVLPVATATQGSSLYPAYITAKATTRTPLAIFGANDGMLHVLSAAVPPTVGGGREFFAFVPRSQYFTLNQLASPAYSHRFYVDGPVIEGDIFNGTVWKTIAVGTTGAGAAGMFAIDITDPTTMGVGSVLWDIVPSEHADATVVSDLGNVLQPGIIGSVKDVAAPNNNGRWVYMVGNGYDSVSHQATLFVFDAFNGSLIKSIQTGVGSAAPASARNGLGGITPVYDGARNIVAVYGGDKQGNLWKFDFSSGNINDPDGAGPQKGWEIYNKAGVLPAPLFTATDSFGNPQPISAAPRITPHGISGVHVGFGTGKLFEPGDQISTQVQSVYVLWDKGQTPTILKTSLQSIALQDAPWDHDGNIATLPIATGDFRQLKAADLAAYDWTVGGFYIPLKLEFGPAEGERILSAGILDAGVLSFTSFQQQNAGTDLCTPGGTSHVYRFNLIGGLGEAGFLGVTGPVVGRRVQPGLVSSAPPIYEPVTPVGPMVDSMTVADAKTMMQNPKYRQQSGRAVGQTPQGTCAHVGLRVDGTLARIPTACAGLVPLRAWGSGVR
jgi:type IV pilus assembly protein PilY1